jgi:RNA polymerase sigma-70 factor (ECF subfamily)
LLHRVSLNSATAFAMVDGPGAVLVLVDGLAAGGDLNNYNLLHAASAELLRRIGSPEKAGGWRAWDVTPDHVCVPPI